MKTHAVRLYGKRDLRLEEFELPPIRDDEILASVITDSVCMSTWKLANQGSEHKKAPKDLPDHPIIVGHELCGELLEVGKKWRRKYQVGDRYVIQANLQLPDRPDCPGYSYGYTGGDATYIILTAEIMERGCLIPYRGESFFEGSLVEPLSCIIGAFAANYHTQQGYCQMGIKPGGNLLIAGGTGPMGYLAIDYALQGPVRPRTVVVTGRDSGKLSRAAHLYSSTADVELTYVDVSTAEDSELLLKEAAGGGYDDIFIMVPDSAAIQTGSKLLNPDGCLNFFAGPEDKEFNAPINFYDIHYSSTHYVGTSGGTTDDMRAAVQLIEERKINVANIVTHVLGLDSAAGTILTQPEIGGGKKVVYTHKSQGLTALADIDPHGTLGEILRKTGGFWSKEAEDYVIENW